MIVKCCLLCGVAGAWEVALGDGNSKLRCGGTSEYGRYVKALRGSRDRAVGAERRSAFWQLQGQRTRRRRRAHDNTADDERASQNVRLRSRASQIIAAASHDLLDSRRCSCNAPEVRAFLMHSTHCQPSHCRYRSIPDANFSPLANLRLADSGADR